MLTSERLRLKPIDKNDIEWMRQARNANRENFLDTSPITVEQQRQWYERYVATEGRDQMFIIQLKDGTPIGTIAIYNIDVASRTADLGRFLLLEEFRHKGYATEAVQCLLDYATQVIRLYKIRVSVYLDNLDAIAIYARAGFSHKRPIVILEKINDKCNFKEPVQLLDATNE